MRLLLDTCSFLWFISEHPLMPESVRKKIIEKEADIFLSVISVWEILLKNQAGRLDFPKNALQYISEAKQKHAIESLHLSEKDMKHLAKLPAIHKDPFDRMLICQVIENDCVLVTSDKAVSKYPVKTLWSD